MRRRKGQGGAWKNHIHGLGGRQTGADRMQRRKKQKENKEKIGREGRKENLERTSRVEGLRLNTGKRS